MNFSCREISFKEKVDWEKLIASSSTASFFQTRDWLSLWEKHFGAKLLLLGVYEDDKLIGIAPFSQDNEKINFLGTTSVLGKELVTDYGDLIALPGKEKIIWQEVLKKLKNKKIILDFIREDSPSFSILQSLGGEAEEIDVAPYLSLSSTWEEYLGQLGRHERHEIRRKIRRLENQKAFQVCDENEPTDIHEFLRLMALSNDQKRDFLSEKMQQYFQDIFSNFWPKKILSLCFLKLKGENIASVLLFHFKDEVLLYNSGFDTTFASLSPGLLLKAYVIKEAIEKGKKRFDFLRGEERYKYDLGAKERKLYRVIFL